MFAKRVLSLLAAAPLFAADPAPVLDYDFAAAVDGRVPNRAQGGAELRLDPQVQIRDGALLLRAGVPIHATAPSAAFTNRLAGARGNELACAFSIRFDRSRRVRGESAVDFGMFTCTRKASGHVEIALQPKANEIMAAPIVLRSAATAGLGEWHHVAFNYSWNRRRYSLYLDGRWQMENGNTILPERLAWQPFRIGGRAQGALRNLVLYDAALDSEELIPCRLESAAFDALRSDANEVARRTANPFLRRWAGALAARADTLKQDPERATRAQVKRLQRDLGNARILAEALAANDGALDRSIVTSFTAPYATQERFMPYTLPRGGRLTRQIRVFAAQGQVEPAAIVIVPFQPVKAFTIRVSDLRCGPHVIPAGAVDVALVKRWYRSGGAWMTYHSDKRQRVLVPGLLLHDDTIVRVDAFRQINELLMHFEEGDTYVDVSGYEYNQRAFDFAHDPFWDAGTLQPLALPEAGRNQQFLFTIQVPDQAEPGFYRGTARLLADGQEAGALEITLRVLPFRLPEAKTYYDLDRTYFSHINTCPGDNEAQFRDGLALLKAYSLHHASGIADAPWKIAIAREMGYPLEELVGLYGAKAPDARGWIAPFGAHPSLITPEHKEILDRIFLRSLRWRTDFFNRQIGSNTVFYTCFSSEASYYPQLVEQYSAAADLYHAHSRGKRFSHSMNDGLIFSAVDTTDMDSTTRIDKRWADLWHAVGGRQINYCVPFPGPENPAIYRRDIGLRNYKAHYDGQMLHGFRCRFWNEFCDWPEDNAYRNFGMAYPQRNAMIPTLALVGTRAAYDDVRYATQLRRQALAYRDDSDPRLAREARRQLAWLERIDGATYDMDAFRAGAAHRILTLLKLVASIKEGRAP
jgi:hypothetical protein